MAASLLVLASNSPRRQELLKLGGWNFETHPAEVDESQETGEAPDTYVLRLAESKARACAVSLKNNRKLSIQEDLIILAADTAVVEGKAILGKPKDSVDAILMLRQLRGHTHQVYTGVAVMRLSDGNLSSDLCVTDVPMRSYNDDEINTYVSTGDPLDKAGAYAIQHHEFHPVETISGCYASVMGLPLCHLARTLCKFEVSPKTDISSECQSSLNYTCPISVAVLHGEQVG
jgi:septum formation protein